MIDFDMLDVIGPIPVSVLVIGSNDRILQQNKAADGIFGSQNVGLHYITALRQPALLDAIESTKADGQDRTAPYFGRADMAQTSFEVSIGTLQTPDGQLLILTFEDKTALEDASQMRRDFVANVSHELRTPLTALLGFVETLQGPARNDPDAQQRFLGIMKNEADRMIHLVEDLLSLSRVEDQERMRPKDAVEMKPLIEESLRALQGVADAHGVTLVADLDAAPATIPGDRDQLRQVLTNLVENAIKYGGDGGQVTVALSASEHQPMLRQDGVCLSVTDQGEGIASHHIARLTERFYRVDSHRSREIGGTGLGLAIVKHIINRHRGRLRVKSQIGQGSVFKVILPST